MYDIILIIYINKLIGTGYYFNEAEFLSTGEVLSALHCLFVMFCKNGKVYFAISHSWNRLSRAGVNKYLSTAYSIQDHVRSFENSQHENIPCKWGRELGSKLHFRLDIVMEFLTFMFKNSRKFPTKKSLTRGGREGGQPYMEDILARNFRNFDLLPKSHHSLGWMDFPSAIWRKSFIDTFPKL